MKKALVLTGGGARGAYQAGVLKFIGENIPHAQFESLLGSSSGAINTAGVASHKGNVVQAGSHLAELWQDLSIEQVFRVDTFSILKIGVRWLFDLTLGGLFGRPLAHSLVDTSPLRALLEKLVRFDRIAEAIAEGKLVHVGVTATEVNSGSAVTFVQSKEKINWQRARRRGQNATLSVEHIMASAAIPLLFPSVLVNNRQYVDGSIRSTAPLSPAARLGCERIFAIGVRRYYTAELGNNFWMSPQKPEARPSVSQLGALVLNSLFSESLDADVEHLERLNDLVGDQREGAGRKMRPIQVLVIRPSEDLGAMAMDHIHELPWLIRYLLRGLGTERGNSSDILSYLLFVPSYSRRLIELGYKDAQAEERRIREFFTQPGL
jgi:NTE family protein